MGKARAAALMLLLGCAVLGGAVFGDQVAQASTPAANARDSRGLDTLQLDGVFNAAWHGVVCPAGTPATIYCTLWAGPGLVPGLGAAEESYEVFVDPRDSSCLRAYWQATLTVAGRGEIDASMQIPGCVNPGAGTNVHATLLVPATFTITGGSGSYAGASGSGTLTSLARETAEIVGTSVDTWQGTLSVPGLSFDTTPPTISGAANLHAKAKIRLGARVSYTLTASDPTDGSLPVTCKPASGTRFPVGRTPVTCSATDKDGNTASAKFTVTVTHVKRR